MIASAQAINPETGTYTFEAAFPNPDDLVLPGQFARVRAPYGMLKSAVVVPRLAISEIQGLHRVYVVGAGNTIEVRAVTPGPVHGNLIVIEKGLQGDETVVVEGLQKVRSGMKVDPQPVATPAEQAGAQPAPAQ